jgi:excisionase family DNA binding protein
MEKTVEAMTAREVARILGLNRATIYKLAAAGELGHLRIGGAVRFRREDVEAFLLRCYRPARTEAGESAYEGCNLHPRSRCETAKGGA